MNEWREKLGTKIISSAIIGIFLFSNFTWTLKTDFSSFISPIIFNHYLNKASLEESVGFFQGLREAISSILLPSASAEQFYGYEEKGNPNHPAGYKNNWRPIAESIKANDTVNIDDTVEPQLKNVEYKTNDTVIEQKNDLADKIILRLREVVNNALRRLIQMNDKLSPSSTGIAGIIQKIKEVYEELLKLSLTGDDSGDEPEEDIQANDNSEKNTKNTGVETAPELLTANNSDDTRRSNAINTETGKTTYSPRNSLVMENISGSSYSTGHGDASQSIMSNYYKNDTYSGNASPSIMSNYYKNDAYSGNASQSVMANYYKNDTYSGNASPSIMANYYKNDAYSTGSGNAWQEMRDEIAARQAEAKNAWQEMRDKMRDEMAARQAEAKNAWQEMRDEIAARQAEAKNAWQEMRDDMAARQAEARAEYAKYRDRFQTMGNYNYENYNPVLSGKITPEDRVSDIEEFIREHSNRGPPDRDSIKKAFDEGAVFNCAWETLVQLLPHVDPLDLARELADPQYTDSETNQTSMFGIYEISKRYGLELTGVELTLNQLKQTVSENGYAIIHEDSGNGMGHWRKITDISEIDIDKWSGNCLVKTVPEGARLLSDEEMKDIWGGWIAAAGGAPATSGSLGSRSNGGTTGGSRGRGSIQVSARFAAATGRSSGDSGSSVGTGWFDNGSNTYRAADNNLGWSSGSLTVGTNNGGGLDVGGWFDNNSVSNYTHSANIYNHDNMNSTPVVLGNSSVSASNLNDSPDFNFSSYTLPSAYIYNHDNMNSTPVVLGNSSVSASNLNDSPDFNFSSYTLPSAYIYNHNNINSTPVVLGNSSVSASNLNDSPDFNFSSYTLPSAAIYNHDNMNSAPVVLGDFSVSAFSNDFSNSTDTSTDNIRVIQGIRIPSSYGENIKIGNNRGFLPDYKIGGEPVKSVELSIITPSAVNDTRYMQAAPKPESLTINKDTNLEDLLSKSKSNNNGFNNPAQGEGDNVLVICPATGTPLNPSSIGDEFWNHNDGITSIIFKPEGGNPYTIENNGDGTSILKIDENVKIRSDNGVVGPEDITKAIGITEDITGIKIDGNVEFDAHNTGAIELNIPVVVKGNLNVDASSPGEGEGIKSAVIIKEISVKGDAEFNAGNGGYIEANGEFERISWLNAGTTDENGISLISIQDKNGYISGSKLLDKTIITTGGVGDTYAGIQILTEAPEFVFKANEVIFAASGIGGSSWIVIGDSSVTSKATFNNANFHAGGIGDYSRVDLLSIRQEGSVDLSGNFSPEIIVEGDMVVHSGGINSARGKSQVNTGVNIGAVTDEKGPITLKGGVNPTVTVAGDVYVSIYGYGESYANIAGLYSGSEVLIDGGKFSSKVTVEGKGERGNIFSVAADQGNLIMGGAYSPSEIELQKEGASFVTEVDIRDIGGDYAWNIIEAGGVNKKTNTATVGGMTVNAEAREFIDGSGNVEHYLSTGASITIGGGTTVDTNLTLTANAKNFALNVITADVLGSGQANADTGISAKADGDGTIDQSIEGNTINGDGDIGSENYEAVLTVITEAKIIIGDDATVNTNLTLTANADGSASNSISANVLGAGEASADTGISAKADGDGTIDQSIKGNTINGDGDIGSGSREADLTVITNAKTIIEEGAKVDTNLTLTANAENFALNVVTADVLGSGKASANTGISTKADGDGTIDQSIKDNTINGDGDIGSGSREADLTVITNAKTIIEDGATVDTNLTLTANAKNFALNVITADVLGSGEASADTGISTKADGDGTIDQSIKDNTINGDGDIGSGSREAVLTVITNAKTIIEDGATVDTNLTLTANAKNFASNFISANVLGSGEASADTGISTKADGDGTIDQSIKDNTINGDGDIGSGSREAVLTVITNAKTIIEDGATVDTNLTLTANAENFALNVVSADVLDSGEASADTGISTKADGDGTIDQSIKDNTINGDGDIGSGSREAVLTVITNAKTIIEDGATVDTNLTLTANAKNFASNFISANVLGSGEASADTGISTKADGDGTIDQSIKDNTINGDGDIGSGSREAVLTVITNAKTIIEDGATVDTNLTLTANAENFALNVVSADVLDSGEASADTGISTKADGDGTIDQSIKGNTINGDGDIGSGSREADLTVITNAKTIIEEGAKVDTNLTLTANAKNFALNVVSADVLGSGEASADTGISTKADGDGTIDQSIEGNTINGNGDIGSGDSKADLTVITDAKTIIEEGAKVDTNLTLTANAKNFALNVVTVDVLGSGEASADTGISTKADGDGTIDQSIEGNTINGNGDIGSGSREADLTVITTAETIIGAGAKVDTNLTLTANAKNFASNFVSADVLGSGEASADTGISTKADGNGTIDQSIKGNTINGNGNIGSENYEAVLTVITDAETIIGDDATVNTNLTLTANADGSASNSISANVLGAGKASADRDITLSAYAKGVVVDTTGEKIVKEDKDLQRFTPEQVKEIIEREGSFEIQVGASVNISNCADDVYYEITGERESLPKDETGQTNMLVLSQALNENEELKNKGISFTGVELNNKKQLEETIAKHGYAIIHEDSGNGMGHWRKITDISEIDIDKWSGNCLVKTIPEGARLLSDEEMKDIWGARENRAKNIDWEAKSEELWGYKKENSAKNINMEEKRTEYFGGGGSSTPKASPPPSGSSNSFKKPAEITEIKRAPEVESWLPSPYTESSGSESSGSGSSGNPPALSVVEVSNPNLPKDFNFSNFFKKPAITEMKRKQAPEVESWLPPPYTGKNEISSIPEPSPALSGGLGVTSIEPISNNPAADYVPGIKLGPDASDVTVKHRTPGIFTGGDMRVVIGNDENSVDQEITPGVNTFPTENIEFEPDYMEVQIYDADGIGYTGVKFGIDSTNWPENEEYRFAIKIAEDGSHIISGAFVAKPGETYTSDYVDVNNLETDGNGNVTGKYSKEIQSSFDFQNEEYVKVDTGTYGKTTFEHTYGNGKNIIGTNKHVESFDRNNCPNWNDDKTYIENMNDPKNNGPENSVNEDRWHAVYEIDAKKEGDGEFEPYKMVDRVWTPTFSNFTPHIIITRELGKTEDSLDVSGCINLFHIHDDGDDGNGIYTYTYEGDWEELNNDGDGRPLSDIEKRFLGDILEAQLGLTPGAVINEFNEGGLSEDDVEYLFKYLLPRFKWEGINGIIGEDVKVKDHFVNEEAYMEGWGAVITEIAKDSNITLTEGELKALIDYCKNQGDDPDFIHKMFGSWHSWQDYLEGKNSNNQDGSAGGPISEAPSYSGGATAPVSGGGQNPSEATTPPKPREKPEVMIRSDGDTYSLGYIESEGEIKSFAVPNDGEYHFDYFAVGNNTEDQPDSSYSTGYLLKGDVVRSMTVEYNENGQIVDMWVDGVRVGSETGIGGELYRLLLMLLPDSVFSGEKLVFNLTQEVTNEKGEVVDVLIFKSFQTAENGLSLKFPHSLKDGKYKLKVSKQGAEEEALVEVEIEVKDGEITLKTGDKETKLSLDGDKSLLITIKETEAGKLEIEISEDPWAQDTQGENIEGENAGDLVNEHLGNNIEILNSRSNEIQEFIREHSNRGPPDLDSIKEALNEGAVFNCAWETLVQLLPHVDPLDLARELANSKYTDSETNQTSMFGIYEISKKYGLELTGVELTLNQLEQTVSENGYAIIHEDSGNGMGHWRKITDISEIDIDKWSGNCLVKTVPEGARLLSDEEMKDIKGAGVTVDWSRSTSRYSNVGGTIKAEPKSTGSSGSSTPKSTGSSGSGSSGSGSSGSGSSGSGSSGSSGSSYSGFDASTVVVRKDTGYTGSGSSGSSGSSYSGFDASTVVVRKDTGYTGSGSSGSSGSSYSGFDASTVVVRKDTGYPGSGSFGSSGSSYSGFDASTVVVRKDTGYTGSGSFGSSGSSYSGFDASTVVVRKDTGYTGSGSFGSSLKIDTYTLPNDTYTLSK